ncbi:DUF3524 domain-containing protein [Pseudenhygromyxa sp. WMMC2535]|uniref:tRNA-queuosine alpha-mannosyltransferase domain-containing protein n=1 Tax=Pseudenhygromyxa sp. WMMC2535 TaxID=2712867 RepID=UPI001552C3A7|nr:DUF3524 domain-containing protein [Pseudenhygromyxa sp. WMMC2535]NVB37050.1 DUF3524 domain-containing protein [Pseudenhygromyxa sp. WMMC2535]
MRVLYLEPFEAGSHEAFGRALTSAPWAEWIPLTLPGRYWKWRMRGSAAYFAQQLLHLDLSRIDLLFASSYLPLAELVGMVPELAAMPRVLYFHENQLAFPVRDSANQDPARDLHFGFTQLVSALAATRCVFNSAHNRDSFLEAGRVLLRRMPDAVPLGWIEAIEARSEVLGLPLELPEIANPRELEDLPAHARDEGPLILWNHRWEHDKGPDALVRILDALLERGQIFRLAVCGQQFRRRPPELLEAEPRLRAALGDRLVQWGFVRTREDYRELLSDAQIALSTAKHEFFGVSMLEAVHCGARPLVPDALSYTELFPNEFRYGDEAEAVVELERLIWAWGSGLIDLRGNRRQLSMPWSKTLMLERYRELFVRLIRNS